MSGRRVVVNTCPYCGRVIRSGGRSLNGQRYHVACHHRMTAGDGCFCPLCTGDIS